jgi:hydroxymethylbilane synthase
VTNRQQGDVRLGTRGSKLSLWQARWVAMRLAAALPGRRIEIVPMVTRGDVEGGPLTELTEAGAFTSELERALTQGRIDVAVHSAKDLPLSAPGAIEVAAVPLRSDPADALVSRDGARLAALPEGARVGTSSPRRASLVRAVRPDVAVLPIRGNVDTRVRRLDDGEYDALLLAVAGLERLGLAARIGERLDPRAFPPAPGQGALAVQVIDADAMLAAAVSSIDDVRAHAAVAAERACLRVLGGGCSKPVGAHATWVDDELELTGVVGSLDGLTVLRASSSGQDAERLGRRVADELTSLGAGRLL